MEWWQVAIWGFLGGFIVDGLEVWRLVRSNNGSWPAQCSSFAFFVAEMIRLISGAVLSVAFGISKQISGPLGALAIGVATPLIVEKLSALLPPISTNSGIDISVGEKS